MVVADDDDGRPTPAVVAFLPIERTAGDKSLIYLFSVNFWRPGSCNGPSCKIKGGDSIDIPSEPEESLRNYSIPNHGT
jgi:hypothetical protein